MIRNPLGVVALLLLASCAQVKEPTGGPKDERPPTLLSAEPPNGSTRFSGSRIVLRFDEKVKLDRVRERLLISPPLAKQPDVTVSGGTDVVITLNAPLADSTTYTFHIGEAVRDLSEGNAAAGLSFVVSTGAHVDSLSLSGRVVDAFSGQAAPNVLVLLHDTKDTGDVRTAPPAYFTRTAADGTFTLAHLRGGAMRLTALLDGNGNYRFDLPNEEIAFRDSVARPGDSTALQLRLFRPVPDRQLVQGAIVLPEGGWQLVLARRGEAMDLRSLDREGGRLAWWPEWSTERDTVVLWPTDTTLLRGQRFILSEGGAELDTLTYRPAVAMPFNLEVAAVRHPVSGAWSLRSSRPVGAVDTTLAELFVDSVRTSFAPVIDSLSLRTVDLGTEVLPGSSAWLILYPKAVTGVLGGHNDTTRLMLGARDPRTLGKLHVMLVSDSGTASYGPLVLQLLNTHGRPVREAAFDALPAEAQWTDLPPGSYGLKVVQDRNSDGRWTTGSFVEGRQPERVFLELEPVVVRAGWAVERTWALPPLR